MNKIFKSNLDHNRNLFENNPPIFYIVVTISICFIYALGGGALTFAIRNYIGIDLSPYTEGLWELLLMLLPAIILIKQGRGNFKSALYLDIKPEFASYLYGTAGIISLIIFTGGYSVLQDFLIPSAFLQQYTELKNSMEEMYKNILGDEGLFNYFRALLIGALIPALSEETLFRGFLQKKLEISLKPLWTIVISSVLFALIHLNPIDIIPLTLTGLFLGISMYSSGSLKLPVFIHFINNLFAITAIYIVSYYKLNNDTGHDLTSAIIFCLAGLAMVIFSAYKLVTLKKQI